MIGMDPHKGSHTTVAVDADETPLAQELVAAGEDARIGSRNG